VTVPSGLKVIDRQCRVGNDVIEFVTDVDRCQGGAVPLLGIVKVSVSISPVFASSCQSPQRRARSDHHLQRYPAPKWVTQRCIEQRQVYNSVAARSQP
jgi:hypothetical protein